MGLQKTGQNFHIHCQLGLVLDVAEKCRPQFPLHHSQLKSFSTVWKMTFKLTLGKVKYKRIEVNDSALQALTELMKVLGWIGFCKNRKRFAFVGKDE